MIIEHVFYRRNFSKHSLKLQYTFKVVKSTHFLSHEMRNCANIGEKMRLD